MNAIIVAIDFSDETENLIQVAKSLAICTNATIYLIHVAAPDPDFIGYSVGPEDERQFISNTFHEEKLKLEHISSTLQQSGQKVIALLLQGATAETLVEKANSLTADFLVIGSHGTGLAKSLIVGSTCHEVLKLAQRPVLVVPCNQKN